MNDNASITVICKKLSVSFTRGIYEELQNRQGGKNPIELINPIIDTVAEISDKIREAADKNDVIKYGYLVLFSGDRRGREATVMTAGEAEALSAEALKGKKWLVRI